MSAQYEHIVRILGNDIPGDKKIIVGLTQIKGVGYMFANTILNTLKINPNQRMGHLSTDHIQLIEKIVNKGTARVNQQFVDLTNPRQFDATPASQ